jgi:medium-chain acyl-[acyl-carrier-protein] hydrolase
MMDKIICFCLPHAGGSSINYLKWNKFFPDDFYWNPLELKGRGSRSEEPLSHDFNEVVTDIFESIGNLVVNDLKYVIFGHSMGGLLAYETTLKLQKFNIPLPLHLFISGRVPPHILKRQDLCLTDEELKFQIFKLGGLSRNILKNREWNDLFLPIIKADYHLLENYQYSPQENRLDIGITAFGGDNDPEVSETELTEWQKYTNKSFSCKIFPGDHFYLNDYMLEISKIIYQDTLNIIR